MDYDAAKINQAIQECLEECETSATPLPHLAEFCGHLQQSGDWNEDEIYAVETRALRILCRLSTPNDFSASWPLTDQPDYSPPRRPR